MFCQQSFTNSIPLQLVGRCKFSSLDTAQTAKNNSFIHYQVIKKIPHDNTSASQGLIYHQGFLYESIGSTSQSQLRKINAYNGDIIQQIHLPINYYAEGISLYNEQLIQLSWQSGQYFVYNINPLKLLTQHEISSDKIEMWGLSQFNKQLIISNGTHLLNFYLISNNILNKTNTLEVYSGTTPVSGLNELETVDNKLYSNIWPTDCIAQINLGTGQVEHWLNLQSLLSIQERKNSQALLNGIAYNPRNQHFFITGKFWPYIFEIKLLPKQRKNYEYLHY